TVIGRKLTIPPAEAIDADAEPLECIGQAALAHRPRQIGRGTRIFVFAVVPAGPDGGAEDQHRGERAQPDRGFSARAHTVPDQSVHATHGTRPARTALPKMHTDRARAPAHRTNVRLRS